MPLYNLGIFAYVVCVCILNSCFVIVYKLYQMVIFLYQILVSQQATKTRMSCASMQSRHSLSCGSHTQSIGVDILSSEFISEAQSPRLARIWKFCIYYTFQPRITRVVAQWLDSRSRSYGFEPHRRHCVVSLSKTLYPLLSTRSSQEDPSRHD